MTCQHPPAVPAQKKKKKKSDLGARRIMSIWLFLPAWRPSEGNNRKETIHCCKKGTFWWKSLNELQGNSSTHWSPDLSKDENLIWTSVLIWEHFSILTALQVSLSQNCTAFNIRCTAAVPDATYFFFLWLWKWQPRWLYCSLRTPVWTGKIWAPLKPWCKHPCTLTYWVWTISTTSGERDTNT